MSKFFLDAAVTLRDHWPEYLIEAWALGMFMISAGVFTVLIEQSGNVSLALRQA